MREMLRNILTLLLLIFPVLNVSSLTYVFRQTNILEKAEYWENNVSPCENDKIYFDDEKITTVLIANGLHSQKIELPTNGILFFDKMAELGRLGSWQCKRRQKAEEVHFKQSPSLGFYNGSNWIISKNGIQWRPALHALQVPSSRDTAIIPSDSGTRILLEDFVTVGALILAGQTVNNDTFNDSFLRSIEGQLQFDLATKLKSIRSIDGIDYQWPKFTNTVAIMGETATKYSAGQFNSNLEAEKLVLICYYQQCQLMARKCAGTFRPIGHCCEICGSMLRFRTTIFNFDKFQKQIENYERENQIVMEYDLDIASLRIDHNDPMPHYQHTLFDNRDGIYCTCLMKALQHVNKIVVLARAGTKHPFDEQIYRVVLKDLAGFVQNNFGIPHSMTVTEIEEIISVNFHSSPKDDFVLALTSLFAIGAIVTGIIFAVGRKFNFANFRGLSSQNSLYEAVHWRGAESEDELELLRYDQSTLNTTANEKYLTNQVPECSSTFENVAFDGEITDDIKEK